MNDLVAGIDIGSLSAKVVIMCGDEIISSAIILTGHDSVKTSTQVMKLALQNCGRELGDINCIVSTGYGRVNVPFAQGNVTEISCHARGNQYLLPLVRTILDMGGQDCKAIRCNEYGRVVGFAMNDKCAAGTGRYLERVARLLNVPLGEVGPKSLDLVNGPVSIDSYCAVFAGNDVIRALREGRHVNDILAGAAEAIVKRILSLIKKVGIEEAFCLSGGVAKNVGIVKRLERELRMKVNTAFEPQLMGSLGAALFAQDKLIGLKRLA